jgi:5-methylcytosine-specific restriction endonuclease McrA
VAESVLELTRALRTALISFQPDQYSGDECALLVEELAGVEKVSAAARVRAAAHAGSCGAHRERGFADVSDWMARATGTTAGSAKAALETATALESQPEAKAALDAGELSFAQARELVRTEAAVPGSTAGLLDVAKGQSLRALKDEARDRRLRAIDPEDLHALQHARMHHRQWTTALGTIAYAGELPPEYGIPFSNRLDAETDRLWLKAHQAASGADQSLLAVGDSTIGSADGDEPNGGTVSSATGGSRAKVEPRRSVLVAQAFVRMMENGGGKGKATRADLVIVCDLQAYRRGHAHEGDACHIVGGGPIPVAVANDLGRDAFLKAVLHNGTEIHTIAHFGRRYPVVLQTALDLGAPPKFDGNVCAASGCDRRYHLQRDHIDPVANGGKTSYANNQPLCPPDHRIKTDRDRRAGLLSRKHQRRTEPVRAGPGP